MLADKDPFDLLERLVALPSPSGDEGPYARVVADLWRDLAAPGGGLDVRLDEVAPGRPNVLALPRGRAPDVVLSTHLDVVPPHVPPRRDGERLFGRGTADTKGPLVAMLLAAEALLREGMAVGFLGVVGEEVDHSGAAHAARTLDLGQAPILLGEPTSNRVVVAQKGLLKVRLTAAGVAGHSAFPDRGVSAIHRLLDHLDALRREPWPGDPVLGPTTLNVGTIAGGVAANVFAPAAAAEVLMRLSCPSAHALARVRALAPDGVTVEVVSHNDPLHLTPPADEPACTIPFNSDASYLAPLGPVWLAGPGAIEVAHAAHEHIDRADLLAGAALYERLARAAVRGRGGPA